MAKTKVVIDPITRIEGHLRVTCVVENGKVTDAWNTCTLFRGFEIFMKDRDPREIWHYTMRICGVCPTPHGWNGVRATEMAMGVDKMDDNTRLIRNMMEASQIAYDHILWFYILNAFDYVNVPNALNGQARRRRRSRPSRTSSRRSSPPASSASSPTMYWDNPGYKLPPDLDLELTAHYLQSIEMQQIANDAGGVFLGGKYPMIMNYAPGGCTQLPRLEDVITYKQRMQTVQGFVDTVVVPDLLAIAPYYMDLATVGQGVGNFLSWGVLDEKSQDPYDRVFPRGGIFGGKLTPEKVDPNETKMFTKSSFYPDSLGGGKHPLDVGQEPQEYVDLAPIEGATLPNAKYDWTQAVRYGAQDAPMEVGPLAQMLMAYTGRAGRRPSQLVDSTLAAVGAAGHPEILHLGARPHRRPRAQAQDQHGQRAALGRRPARQPRRRRSPR